VTRLVRPYIPLDVRLKVAERQLGYGCSIKGQARSERLRLMLLKLFDGEPCHLDHDPALENRPYSDRTGRYTPDANDSEFLIYRTVAGHKIKTYVRGDGALRSDAGQRRYLKKVAHNRDKSRRNVKIPSRINPWPPKGSHKLRSR
jgi:hypothetical protein